ncbi:MAG TPA: TIGR03435 family protein [Vicinamibacterales bacterium]|nr:TIGR03435 family protein [Vicinamibacterales bacterium]
MKTVVLVLTAVLFAANAAAAQTSEKFEVASVKPSTTGAGPPNLVVDPGRFTATGVVLADLIRYAYGFNALASQSQVSGGPSWITTTRFDIVATSKGQPTLSMLKALLEDRFKVAAHVESREVPTYALLVERPDGRLGPAIHPSTSTCEGAGGTLPPTSSSANTRCGIQGRPGSYRGDGTSLSQLARALGNFPAIGRAVVDRTSVTGVFDWTLEWTPVRSTTGR